tara:strand:- start:852 stop:1145 length:294 start_codon:yes stop_codon:yes gene_type:complete
MDKSKMNEYEKYLVLASYESVLSGGYEGYVNMRDVIKVLEGISQKQNTSYLYNDEFKESPLTIKEVNTILDCWNDGKHRSGLNKIRLLARQIGVRKI